MIWLNIIVMLVLVFMSVRELIEDNEETFVRLVLIDIILILNTIWWYLNDTRI